MSVRHRRPSRSGSRRLFAAIVEHLETRQLLSGGYTFDHASSNAMAMDSGGKLYVAYYDTSAKNLKYAIREANGAWSTTAGTIDAGSAPSGFTPDVGLSVSMDLDSAGNPGVAYTDSVNADLKYAHWNGSGWDVQIVGGSTGKLGNYPSLKYVSDKPTISHFVKTSSSGQASAGYLRVDQGSTPNPSTSVWTNTAQGAIDNTGDAGRFSSIRFNGTKWGISYDDDLNVAAKYAESSTSSIASTWTKTTVPVPSGANAGGAFWTSLVFDSSGRPAFAYYDTTELNVNVAYRGSGTTWSNTVVDGRNTTGKYPNLVLESGTFRVAYYDETQKTVEVQSSTDGVTWGRDADLLAGVGSELKAIRSGGTWTFAWQDAGGAVHVNNDKTGQSWTQESSGGTFGARREAAGVVFDDNDANHPGPEMWVIGGLSGGGRRNDVWASNDGMSWRNLLSNGSTGAFAARTGHVALVFDDGSTSNPGEKMWVIGGQTGSAESSDVGDVWWSQNGSTWTQVLDGNGVAVNMGARRDHAAAVYNGKMYVIGGLSPTTSTYPDYPVVYSSDGVTWDHPASLPDSFANRYGASALAYDGALYVFGGSGANTNTYKFDGTSWTLAGTPNLTLTGGEAIVYDEKMWYLTGAHAYWSTDGVKWTSALDDPDGVTPFTSGRTGFVALTYAKAGGSNRMWLLGGYFPQGGTYKDDVWSSD